MQKSQHTVMLARGLPRTGMGRAWTAGARIVLILAGERDACGVTLPLVSRLSDGLTGDQGNRQQQQQEQSHDRQGNGTPTFRSVKGALRPFHSFHLSFETIRVWFDHATYSVRDDGLEWVTKSDKKT
jgi:hypothetical protein